MRTDPYSHSPIFCVRSPSFGLVFLHDLRPPSTTMAAELPPSRFKTMSSLATLRLLMGWQAPGLTRKGRAGPRRWPT
jgi:hypothetical protein